MKYNIKDESNDRKYFTIVPNFILNHSSAIDQALYLQMKRAAGENGICFMTQRTLCDKLGIGMKSLRKSLEYLCKHGWIKFIGITPSKTRPIKTYKIVDIWNENIEYYNKKKIVSKRTVSKDSVQEEKDSVQKNNKIVSKRIGIRRTHIKEEPIKKIKENNIKEKTEIYINRFNQLFKRDFKITPGRITKLKVRLETFTLEEILTALEKLSQSPWHRGINDRGWTADPDFLIRNNEQVDNWINKDMDEARKLANLNKERRRYDSTRQGVDARGV
jgi:hypothetical protein